jgi:hypothetical protein
MPQAERSTLRTRPRNRAGQVSATSIEPTAHSPFNAKRTMLYNRTKLPHPGDSATSGIASEKTAMLSARIFRRPNLSASHGHR